VHVFEIPSVAVIVTLTWLVTADVVTVKFADREPGGMVTVGGTLATLGSLLVRVTAIDPVETALRRYTVPVTACPP
jgi:hypothetical protein